jgi:hypothetical protein
MKRLLILSFFLAFSAIIYGQSHLGVWVKGQQEQILVRDETWSSFNSLRSKYGDQSFRLIDFKINIKNGTLLYDGIFEKFANGNHAFLQYESKPAFDRKNEELQKSNYRLVHVESFTAAGKQYYTGIWHPGSYEQRLHVFDSWVDFNKMREEMQSHSFYLIDIEVFKHENGKTYFMGIFNKLPAGSPYAFFRCPNWGSLTKLWAQYKNVQLVDVEYVPDGDHRFYAVWNPGNSTALYLYHNQDDFDRKRDELRNQGWKMKDIEIFK